MGEEKDSPILPKATPTLALEAIVCTPHPLSARGEGGFGPPTKFSKSGGLARPQLLEGGCWERGGWLFLVGGGCNFHIKNKLKFEILKYLMIKKVYKQKYISLS